MWNLGDVHRFVDELAGALAAIMAAPSARPPAPS
jgi:hypothetical protein